MDDFKSLIGTDVYDAEHNKVGTLGDIYLDDETDKPVWATVNTESEEYPTCFIPLLLTRLDTDGLVVIIRKEQILHAPHIEADGQIDDFEESNLYQYYRDIVRERREEQKARLAAAQEDSRRHEAQHHEETSGYEEHHPKKGQPIDVAVRTDSEQWDRELSTSETEGVSRLRIRKYIVTEIIKPAPKTNT